MNPKVEIVKGLSQKGCPMLSSFYSSFCIGEQFTIITLSMGNYITRISFVLVESVFGITL